MLNPRMPFRGDLSGIVIVLSKVHPSMTTWYLLMLVQVLEISISELVLPDKSS